MLAIAEGEEAGGHVELVNLVAWLGGLDVVDGAPKLIVHVNLDGVLHDRVTSLAALIGARDKRVAAGEFLVLLTRGVRLGDVPIATNDGVLLVEGRGATVHIALKGTTVDVGHPILLRGSAVIAALVVLIADLEITDAEGFGMAELSALIGPSNTTIGVGTPLGVQELDHVGGVERVTAADAVDHDDLGVHRSANSATSSRPNAGIKPAWPWLL